ncbi:MAG TPA: YceI family protein [Geothrix sp.]|nr:YceI family protein [Geothrix sp.]
MLLRALLPALLLAAPLLSQPRHFRVDETHTVLGFKASTLLFDVPGRFTRYQAEIQGDPSAPEGATVRLDIDAKSVSTDNATRDGHLRSPDFFDVARYPKISFVSQGVRKEGDHVLVHGTLTMHGVSRPLDLSFQGAEGMNGAGARTWSYRATLPLDRLDFGIGAESVAAKISLKREVELNLLLVGFFEESPAPVQKAAARRSKAPAGK